MWRCGVVAGGRNLMPEEQTLERAREDEREGKSPSTQAGEFVREEIHHVREGKHGARSAKQAIAIGLSKARRAGVKLPAPKGSTSPSVRKQAHRDTKRGQSSSRPRPSRTRSRATENALRKESTRTTSRRALSSQARSSARRRSSAARRGSARKAARTRQRTRSTGR